MFSTLLQNLPDHRWMSGWRSISKYRLNYKSSVCLYGIKRCSISSRRFCANRGHALNIKVTKTLFNWFLKHLMQSKIYVSKKAKNLSTLEIILITCIFHMVSLMTYCIRSLLLLHKQRSYLICPSVVGQIRDFCWKTLKLWGNEIWVVFAVPSKSNHFIYCIMIYGRALSLGFSYSRCGAYWYKVAVARTFKKVNSFKKKRNLFSSSIFSVFKDFWYF